MITKGWRRNKSQETLENRKYKMKRRETFKLLHRFRGNRVWKNKQRCMESRKELADLREKLIKDQGKLWIGIEREGK